jgi:hypothetical protein
LLELVCGVFGEGLTGESVHVPAVFQLEEEVSQLCYKYR